MAAVDLGRADVSLFADPIASRVEVPYLSVFQPQESREVAFRRFEGFAFPFMFRGEGRSRVLRFEAMYPRSRHADAAALVGLFRFAADEAADGRLQVRTHTGLVSGVDELEVVGVASWADVPQRGQYRVVSFEATRVAYSLGV